MMNGAAFESDLGNDTISSDSLCQTDRAVTPFDQFSG